MKITIDIKENKNGNINVTVNELKKLKNTKETEFNTIEQYDANLTQGSVIVTQEGQKGLERVSQNVKTVNGEIEYVDPAGKQVLKE